MVQPGADANEAQVFRAHTAPQGLCEHLINALKLLANQQTDGDTPIPSIVTVLQERSRQGIMDGLRSIIEMDNHSAMDVGHLRRSVRLFKVQRPKFSEDYSEVLREGADDLTLRAEEVHTLKACINVDHIKDNSWGPPLVDADWQAFCRCIYRGLNFNNGRAALSLQRDEPGSWSQEKPSESQKAKALLGYEGNQRQGGSIL